MIAVVLVLAVVALVTVFSVQNASPVAVSFLFWKFEASLAIVIFLSVLCGLSIGAVLLFSRKMRHSIHKEKKPGMASTNE